MGGKPFRAVLPHRPQPAGGDMRRQQRHAAVDEVDVAGQRIVHRRRAAAIGDVRELDPGLLAEQRHGEMPDAAAADRAVADLAGRLLGGLDDVRKALVGFGRMGRDHVGRGADQAHRLEVLLVVEREIRQQHRVDRVIVEGHEPGAAVGRRFRHHRGAGRARRAGPVLDHDADAQPLLQPGLRQPRHRVDRSAGRKRHDDPDRSRRPGLCARAANGASTAPATTVRLVSLAISIP